MIRDIKKWEQWKRDYARNTPLDVERNVRRYQALYDHARLLGVLPRKNPLEGIEFKIRVARDIRIAGQSARKNRDGS